jgi:iron complex outermembrane recepter protein
MHSRAVVRPSVPRHTLLPFSLWALFLLLGSLQAFAQSGQVSGTIKDPDQSVVAGAIVTLRNAHTATPLQTTTNDAGQYTFSSVAPGSYRLKAHKAGFVTAVVPAVIITANQMTVTQDAAFALAGDTSSVTVTGGSEGTPATGYYTENVDQGVLGTAPVLNQPFMITEMPSDEIANTQVKNLRDAIKYLPLVSYSEQQGPEILRPSTRGLQGAIEQNTMMDGLNMAITGANPMEQYQEMQVENGLGASLYGPANPSGMFDFVLKRPTEERTNNIYLEQDSSSVGTIYGDFAGRLGRHKIFGYRTNLLYGDGTQFVAESRLRRRLAEFAFDIRPSDRTTLDAHYSVYDVVQRGYQGWFTYGPDKTYKGATTQNPAPTLILPTAPDPTRVGYGQAYAGVNLTTQSTSARLLHDFSPNWHAMMGGLAQRLDRFMDTPVNNITDNNGNYNSSLATGFAPRFGTESDLGYITGTIDRWHLKQDVVIASNGYRFNQYSYTTPSAASVLLGSANINNPVVFAPPAAGLPKNVGLYQSAVVHQQGFNLGDMIYFPKRFAVRLAASQDWIGVDNNSATTRISGSNKNGISPSVSVMYKPTLGTTAYATFASSLQQGDVAPGGTVNANQALAPYRSNEWELGYKTDGKPLNISTALFRLQRPFANTVAYDTTGKTIFEISGMQVNYGAEVSAQGTLFHRLLIDGGFTALDARLTDTGISATNDKRFVGIPGYHSNLLSEYRVPGVANLSITGDWEFTGRRTQDDENLHSTPGFNTFDLGFRYSRTLFTKLATLRFTTNNITNTHYYSTIAAGDITGTNASSNTAHLGSPRTISSSLEFSF